MNAGWSRWVVGDPTLAEPLRSPPHKRSFIRVTLGRGADGWTARPSGGQGSHVLSALSRADGLAEIPEDTTSLAAGDRVKVHLLVGS